MNRAARLLTIAIAVGATVAFTLVRNHYDLEDSAFIATLATFCAGAATTTTAVSLALRSAIRAALADGLIAGLLVPLLLPLGSFPCTSAHA